MKLMSGEKKILESDKGQLVLTTHRVRYDVSAAGQRKIVSIMLGELCSCELNYQSYILLIILSAFSLLLGVAGSTYGAVVLVIGIIACIVFAAAFFLTKKTILSLSSAGAVINVETKGMKPEMIKEFIDAVESAKFEIRT